MFGWQLRPGAHGGKAPFSPRSLFVAGEQGWWFDNSDLSTLFQDAAGTVPVTGPGQPVGLQLDKSARGNHRFQPVQASRPMLRQNATTGAYYLETDGSDDWMRTNSIDFTGTDKVTLFTGLRKLSDAALGMLAELSASFGANGGAFGLTAPASVGPTYYAGVSQAPGTFRTATVVGFPAPRSDVLTASLVCSATTDAARVRLRVGGIEPAPTYGGLAGAAVAAFGNYPAYFFRRGGTTLPFNGHEYSSICVGRLCTAAEIGAVERLLAQRTGVQLA